MDLLSRYGWDQHLVLPTVSSSLAASPDAVPARVVAQERDRYRVLAAQGELLAEPSGRYRRSLESPLELPLVGDWVLVEPPQRGRGGPCFLTGRLPRRTLLLRQRPGRATLPQGIAANVDLALVVTAPDRDLAPRRMERYLALLAGSGVRPLLVLNKCDLIDDGPELAADLAEAVPGARVLVVSAHTGLGLEALRAELAPGETVALLGSSGVGKSSLLNRLIGHAAQETQPVRACDDRGRHTTTRRELFPLEGGALLLDTPGLREVGPWSGEGLDETWGELAELAAGCRFRDCTHEHEPGCAVLSAAEAGEVDPDRLESYCKLRRELDRRESLQARRTRYESRRRDRRERLNAQRRITARDPGWD